jgi:flagellar biosynthesis/type III secretory pathway protein FliH
MSDSFVSLTEFLRKLPAPERCDEEPLEPVREVCSDVAAGVSVDQEEAAELDTALSEVRQFRAALADAVAFASTALLEDVAAAVLARELQLAPADIAAIVADALARYREDDPLVVRVHPEDAAALAQFDVKVVPDASLRRADASIELRCGTIDATLGARLARVLAPPRAS